MFGEDLLSVRLEDSEGTVSCLKRLKQRSYVLNVMRVGVFSLDEREWKKTQRVEKE